MEPSLSTTDLSELKFTAVKVDLSSLTSRRKHQVVVISTLTTASELNRMVALKANMQEKQAPLMRLLASVKVKSEGHTGQEVVKEVKFSNHQKPLKMIEAYPKDAVRLYLQWKTDEELDREKAGGQSTNQPVSQSTLTSPRDCLKAWNQAATEAYRQRADSMPLGAQRGHRRGRHGADESSPAGVAPDVFYQSSSNLHSVEGKRSTKAKPISQTIASLNYENGMSECVIEYEPHVTSHSNIMASPKSVIMSMHNSVASPRPLKPHNAMTSSTTDVASLGKLNSPWRREAPPPRHHVEMVDSEEIRRARLYNDSKSKMAAVSKWASFAGLSKAADEFPDYRPTRHYKKNSQFQSGPLETHTESIPGERIDLRLNLIENELQRTNPKESRNGSMPLMDREAGGTEPNSARGDQTSDGSSAAAGSDPGASFRINSDLIKPIRRFLPELSVSDEAVEERLNVLSARLEKKLKVGQMDGKKFNRSHRSSLASSSGGDGDHKLEKSSSKKDSNKRWSMNDAEMLGAFTPADVFVKDLQPKTTKLQNRKIYDYDDTMSVTSMEVANILSQAPPMAPPAESLYEKPAKSAMSDVEEDDGDEIDSLDQPEGLSSSDESHSDHPSHRKQRHRQNLATRNRVIKPTNSRNPNGLESLIDSHNHSQSSTSKAASSSNSNLAHSSTSSSNIEGPSKYLKSAFYDDKKYPSRKFPTSFGGGSKDVLTLFQILQTRALHCVTALHQPGGRQLAFEVFNDVIYLETVMTSSGSSSSSSLGGGTMTREIARRRYTVPVVGEVHSSRQWRFVDGCLEMGDIIIEINGEPMLSESAMVVIESCKKSNELRIVIARPRPSLVDHGTSMRSLKL